MSETLRPFPDVNRTIHEPARLAILVVLSNCQSADFLFIESVTGLSRGNLSVQITNLEGSGLVSIEKTIQKKRTLTTISLTSLGRNQLTEYWQTMDEIKLQSQRSPAA
jgi:DNA-binding MarR family transcriptional regulator